LKTEPLDRSYTTYH